jgi:aspartokinase-like uncharacterized kinase
MGIFKPTKDTMNVAVSSATHKTLVDHIQAIDGKIGKFVDKAILEKINKDNLRTIEVAGNFFMPDIYTKTDKGIITVASKMPAHIIQQIIDHLNGGRK